MILYNKLSLVKSIFYMERLYKNIIGTAVVDEDFGRPLTTVKNVIMDPESGKLIALVVDINKNLIITPHDILSWTGVIKIHSSQMIIDAREVLRVEAVQKKRISIMDNKVVTEEGKNLGRVVNFSIHEKTLELKNLHIAKMILGLIRLESRIMPANRIIEVLPRKIVVKDDKGTVKEEAEIQMKDVAVG